MVQNIPPANWVWNQGWGDLRRNIHSRSYMNQLLVLLLSSPSMKYHSCCFSNGPNYPTSKLGVESRVGRLEKKHPQSKLHESTSRAPFSITLMKYHGCCFSSGPNYPTSKLGVESRVGRLEKKHPQSKLHESTSRAPFSITLMKYHSCCFSNGPKYPDRPKPSRLFLLVGFEK